ncbi:MAG TPA: HU family DNA-binding protein [Blastocatellia bacterium]|jgi:integration host factor subunit beta
MTKAELVEEVARAAELNKRDAEVIVETVFESIIGALHKGEKVELRGFGSFRTRERGPRRGRNPKTGEPVDVPAKRVPYFKPGKELKEYFTESPDDGGGAESTRVSGEAGAPAGNPASLSAGADPPGREAAGGTIETGEAGTATGDPAAASTPPAGQSATVESSEPSRGDGGEGSTGGSSGY